MNWPIVIYFTFVGTICLVAAAYGTLKFLALIKYVAS